MSLENTLKALGQIRTPIIYDAVEKFNVRPRTDGIMDPSIRAQLPGLGPMVGYACTGKVVGAHPPTDGETTVPWRELWELVDRAPSPTVVVAEDLDHPPARSCAWGDVAASLMLRLGAVGAVTNGGIRDLPEVENLGFQLCAPAAVVGHAHIRWVEIDVPVKVGSLIVHPGDLIHADEHGVMTIPKEIPPEELLRFVHEFLASEKTIVDYCSEGQFDIDTLCRLMEEHNERTSGHMSS
ncbi:MAG: RraA family protein [Pirellulales bacterium]|nr:RraA family protein [Pirellulales bacterium]